MIPNSIGPKVSDSCIYQLKSKSTGEEDYMDGEGRRENLSVIRKQETGRSRKRLETLSCVYPHYDFSLPLFPVGRKHAR